MRTIRRGLADSYHKMSFSRMILYMNIDELVGLPGTRHRVHTPSILLEMIFGSEKKDSSLEDKDVYERPNQFRLGWIQFSTFRKSD